MAEDYYGDTPDNPSSDTADPASKEETKASETKTALIDSSICPGMEPGDEMVVKIEKVMDKEYLVSYAPEPESEEPEPSKEMPPSDMPMGQGQMASMME